MINNNYNQMITSLAQRYNLPESAIYQQFQDYMNSQRTSPSDVIKRTIQDEAKNYVKGQAKDYVKGQAKQYLGGLFGIGAGAGGSQLLPESASTGTVASTATSAVPEVTASTASTTGENLLPGTIESNAFTNLAGALAAAYGGYNSLKGLGKDGEDIRTNNAITGAGIGTMIAPGLGTVAGGAIGNATGYLADKFAHTKNPIVKAGIAMLNPISAIQGALFHKTTAQRRAERRNKLAKDENNSWNVFANQASDSATQQEIKNNMEKAYANTADDYVGWYDDPNTANNEWTWVNKKSPEKGFKQNDINYQKSLGSGDIMWMPTFFENIPEWANLSMEQRDKIADKALQLGTSTERGIRGNAGDLDISKDLWKGELGDYAKQVIGGTDDSESGSAKMGSSEEAKTDALSTTNSGRPIGVVGSIFYPGDGSAPVYIGNYGNANAINNQLEQAKILAGLNKDNSYSNVFNAFMAPFMASPEKKEDHPQKKNSTSDLMSYIDEINQKYTNPFDTESSTFFDWRNNY